MQQSGSVLRFEPEWHLTLVTVVLLPVLVSLGLWQLHRAEEKTALILSSQQRQLEAPVPLSAIRDWSAQGLAYLPVTLAGTFLQAEYFLRDNCIHEGRFGYEVLGILQLEDGDGVALVNRGWVPGDPARLELPVVPPVVGRVTLTGHVYVAPGKPYLLAEQRLGPDWPKIIQAIEMEKLQPPVQALAGASVFPYPVRIDAGAPGALVVDWQVINVSPQKHFGYAFQWFGMALVLAIFYLFRCSNLWQWLRSSRSTPVK